MQPGAERPFATRTAWRSAPNTLARNKERCPAAARACRRAEYGGVEVEYVDPDRGRERRPLAACWSSRFERVFSRTGAHVGCESWVERDLGVALDVRPAVEAVASRPMWLH